MDIPTLGKEKEDTSMSVKEYKCKCEKLAAFFYLVCSDMSVVVYNDPSYWDDKDSFKGSLNFTFVCSRCLPIVFTLERRKGNRPFFYIKNETAKLGHKYLPTHIGLKEYILKYGGE